MSNLPAVTGNRLIKALKKLGFDVDRTKGSHHFLKHPDGRCTVVPSQQAKILAEGLWLR